MKLVLWPSWGMVWIRNEVVVAHLRHGISSDGSGFAPVNYDIVMSRWPTRCTILINRFSFHRFFFLSLHVSNELLVWYSILCSAPDDEWVIRSKHVQQEKTVE